MTEHHIVQRGQKPHRHHRVRVGQRRPGKVEQLLPALAPVHTQLRPQLLDDLPQPRRAAPRLDVLHGGRPESGEMPPHEPPPGGIPGERTAQPLLRQSERRRAPAPPGAVRWRMHDREQPLDRAGQGDRVASGPAFRQQPSELRPRERAAGEGRPGHGGELGQVHTRRLLAEGGLLPAVQHRLEQRTHPQVVLRRDQVLGPPEQGRAHHRTLLEQLRQLVQPEALDPAPQPDVGRIGILRLQPGQPLDDRGDGQVRAPRQQLAFQRGPVEGPARENFGHGVLSPVYAPSTATGSRCPARPT